MAKARALDKRRKSVRNIRKITRTMELIATARFKKAMDRATAATAYTKRITDLVSSLAQTGLEVSHPLLEPREETQRAILLVLTGNRGLCGGYNGNATRAGLTRWNEFSETIAEPSLEVSGKRGVSAFKYRGVEMAQTYTHFDDKPAFADVDVLAARYLDAYAAGQLDRLDVVYTRFVSASKQKAVVETLLPLGSLDVETTEGAATGESMYEFMPSAESILEEVVPTSFKIKLFKCFLDAAVSEQIARMVAMKSATENAGELIKELSRTYNRARQSQITGEIMEIIGGVEALKK
jgi:F-type H+-transporting ATPase subunit gamma